jgi:hypothetical protein
MKAAKPNHKKHNKEDSEKVIEYYGVISREARLQRRKELTILL